MIFYIDPGTGSMLFTILVGILGACVYAFRKIFMKIRFLLSGGKIEKMNSNRIPFVIFADDKRYWNTFKSICEEFDKRGKKLVYMTASPDDPALSEKFENVKCEFIGEGNKAFAKLNMLNADVVLSTTPGLDVYQWKRSKEVNHYSHVLHSSNDPSGYRMFGLDYYDSIILCGEYQNEQIRKLEKLRNLPQKELPLLGLPYFDAMSKRLNESEKQKEHETTVLLAPSWGPSSIFNRYGTKMIDALLKTKYHIIIRPHPQSYTSEKEMLKKLKEKYPENDQLEWNNDNDNFEVLKRSDILISDFSGVLFDFALVFDKPIIYADTSYDKSPYDAWWLEDEMWTFKTLSKIGQKLSEDKIDSIKEVIDKCLVDTKYKENREQARKESWVNPNESSSKIVDYLIKKQKEIEDKRMEESKNTKKK